MSRMPFASIVRTPRRGVLLCALTLSTASGCFGLFEALDPDGLCAPFEDQVLDPSETTRAGFSGADLFAAVNRVGAIEVQWLDAPNSSSNLSFALPADAKLSLVVSADPKSECDSEVSEVQLPTSLRLEPQAISYTGALSPLLSGGELSFVSFDGEATVWASGPYAGQALRIKVRAPASGAPAPGDDVGALYVVGGGCEGETGGCDDERVADLISAQ